MVVLDTSQPPAMSPAISHIGYPALPELYTPCILPRNHADCIGNYCDAVLSGDIVTSAASPRLDFGVSPNCASRLREW
jgi:hypothetical protein